MVVSGKIESSSAGTLIVGCGVLVSWRRLVVAVWCCTGIEITISNTGIAGGARKKLLVEIPIAGQDPKAPHSLNKLQKLPVDQQSVL